MKTLGAQNYCTFSNFLFFDDISQVVELSILVMQPEMTGNNSPKLLDIVSTES